MKTTFNNLFMTLRSFVLAAAFVAAVFAIGCSESGNGNPVACEAQPETTVERATTIQYYALDGTDQLAGINNDEYCEQHQIGYIQFQNWLRCEAVVVEVDGYEFARLEPNSGVSAFLPTGKHLLMFRKVHSYKPLRELATVLYACDNLTFSTGTDVCAQATK